MNCKKVNSTKCDESIFIGSGWRCNDNTTTSTTFTTTSSTSTSSTTTTTTTLAPKIFTIINESTYEDIEYYVFAIISGTPVLASGIVQPDQEIIHSIIVPAGASELTIWLKTQNSGTIFVTTVLSIPTLPDNILSFPNGTRDVQYNNVPTSYNNYEVVIDNLIIPTTTTSTTTSTTSTTTSSTTTTTTTTVPDPFEINVVNQRTAVMGHNISANWGTFPFSAYFPLTGMTTAPSNTSVYYNSTFGNTNQTSILYQNTGNSPVTVGVYYSNNNGGLYSLLGTYNLSAHAGGSAPYPSFNQTFNTPPNNTGVKNILQMRVTNGAYSTSNYIIRIVNNAGYGLNLAQVINRASPSNTVYSTTNNLTLNSGSSQQLYSGNLLEANTRVTLTNAGEQFIATLFFSNNNGANFSNLGVFPVNFAGNLDTTVATPSPGNSNTCILEIRLT